MVVPPQFALKWVSFEESLKSFLGEIKGQEEFTDVTLVTGDGQRMDCHKMILSAFSPVLRAMFGQKSSHSTLLFLRGVSSKCLGAIVDFMYLGEVNIMEEDLAEFLAVAEDLQMKGLTTNEEVLSSTPQKLKEADNKEKDNQIKNPKEFDDQDHQVKKLTDEKNLKAKEESANTFVNVDTDEYDSYNDKPVKLGGSISQEGLDEILSNSMVKIEGGFSCTKCEKQTFGSKHGKYRMKRHIEAKHVAGLEFNCQDCGKKFTSRKSIECHVRNLH